MNQETINKELANTISNKNVINYAKFREPKDYQDLLQEVYLIAITHDRIADVVEKKQTVKFVNSIIHFQTINHQTKFRKLYTKHYDSTSEFDLDLIEDEEIYENKNELLNEIDIWINQYDCKKSWYYKSLWKQYCECGSYRKLANKLDVHYLTIHKHINIFKDLFKAKFNIEIDKL
jgi:DNA-directed RNA polymerase specialized sigma24 family protein